MFILYDIVNGWDGVYSTGMTYGFLSILWQMNKWTLRHDNEIGNEQMCVWKYIVQQQTCSPLLNETSHFAVHVLTQFCSTWFWLQNRFKTKAKQDSFYIQLVELIINFTKISHIFSYCLSITTSFTIISPLHERMFFCYFCKENIPTKSLLLLGCWNLFSNYMECIQNETYISKLYVSLMLLHIWLKFTLIQNQNYLTKKIKTILIVLLSIFLDKECY